MSSTDGVQIGVLPIGVLQFALRLPGINVLCLVHFYMSYYMHSTTYLLSLPVAHAMYMY